MINKTFKAVVATTILLSAGSAFALTCGQTTDPQRLFSLSPAAQCQTGSGNPQAGDILTEYPGTTWTNLGDITVSGDNSAYLDITLTGGAFGSSFANGTWTLDPSFWFTYGQAVISMHSGNGNPEHASFLLFSLATGGTWDYKNYQRGGGFSNFILWGRGAPACTSTTQPGCGGGGGGDDDNQVPEPGSLALLGLGLIGLGATRRRVRA